MMAGVSEALMPKGGADGGGDVSFGMRWTTQGVEGARAIASKNLYPTGKGFHRKTKGIKFDRTIIIDSKFLDRDKIFDYVWNNKNVTKVERFRGGKNRLGTHVSNRKRCTIAYSDSMRRRRLEGGEITRIGSHMG
jgi:hypothetical protein